MAASSELRAAPLLLPPDASPTAPVPPPPGVTHPGDAVESKDWITGEYGLCALAGPANRQVRPRRCFECLVARSRVRTPAARTALACRPVAGLGPRPPLVQRWSPPRQPPYGPRCTPSACAGPHRRRQHRGAALQVPRHTGHVGGRTVRPDDRQHRWDAREGARSRRRQTAHLQQMEAEQAAAVMPRVRGCTSRVRLLGAARLPELLMPCSRPRPAALQARARRP